MSLENRLKDIQIALKKNKIVESSIVDLKQVVEEVIDYIIFTNGGRLNS